MSEITLIVKCLMCGTKVKHFTDDRQPTSSAHCTGCNSWFLVKAEEHKPERPPSEFGCYLLDLGGDRIRELARGIADFDMHDGSGSLR